MSKPRRKRRRKAAPDKPEGYRQTIHLGLKALDLENLDKIAAMMRRDPMLGSLQAKIGRVKAARFAFAYCVAHPPAHITG